MVDYPTAKDWAAVHAADQAPEALAERKQIAVYICKHFTCASAGCRECSPGSRCFEHADEILAVLRRDATPPEDLFERFAEILAPAIDAQAPYARQMIAALVREANAAALHRAPEPAKGQVADMIERLRWSGQDAMTKHLSLGMAKLHAEAADLIESLTAALAEAREKLDQANDPTWGARS